MKQNMDYLAMLVAMTPECDDITDLELEQFIRTVPGSLDPWLYGKTFSRRFLESRIDASLAIVDKTYTGKLKTERLLQAFEDIKDNGESLI